jgi:hypothetical protein
MNQVPSMNGLMTLNPMPPPVLPIVMPVVDDPVVLPELATLPVPLPFRTPPPLLEIVYEWA